LVVYEHAMTSFVLFLLVIIYSVVFASRNTDESAISLIQF